MNDGEYSNAPAEKMPEEMPANEDINAITSSMNKMTIDVIGKHNDEDHFDEDEVDSDFSDYQELDQVELPPSIKHKKLTSLEERARDDMDFRDEVDTPLDITARERFNLYRGVDSLRNCSWDPYENLPAHYAKIFRFQNFQQSQREAMKKSQLEGLPINGTYIRLILKPVDEKTTLALADASNKSFLVLSTLHAHETKISINHFRVKRTEEDRSIVENETPLEFHIGFRRFTFKPVFSEMIKNSKVSKMHRFFPHGHDLQASVVSPICFPPGKVIVFRRHQGQLPTLIAAGAVLGPDPMKIILKKIVITGYPMRVHKKKAVVRFMFFNPEDVHYFRPVELFTKYGRRGKIKESLGTHGLMKCYFNDHIT